MAVGCNKKKKAGATIKGFVRTSKRATPRIGQENFTGTKESTQEWALGGERGGRPGSKTASLHYPLETRVAEGKEGRASGAGSQRVWTPCKLPGWKGPTAVKKLRGAAKQNQTPQIIRFWKKGMLTHTPSEGYGLVTRVKR